MSAQPQQSAQPEHAEQPGKPQPTTPHTLWMMAGGEVTCPDGRPLQYGRIAQRLLVPGFIAWGDPAAKAKWAVSGT